jgi:hypothetical protein
MSKDLADYSPIPGVPDPLEERTMHKVTDKIFVSFKKAKVHGGELRVWALRSDFHGPKFATVTMELDTSRQRMQRLVLGIVDLRDLDSRHEVKELVAWIVKDRISILTGFFGHDVNHLVHYLAVAANAIYQRPLFQGIQYNGNREHVGIYPSFFMFFGFHRRIQVADPIAEPPAHYTLGDDIWNEMIEEWRIPEWPVNDYGNPFCRDLGFIKTKGADWSKWIDHVFQTCVWLGTSTPGTGSQKKQLEYGKTNKGKGKRAKGKDGNDGCKGMGKWKHN